MNNQNQSVSHLQTVAKEQMLERIYEVIADKTLSFWCRVVCDIFGKSTNAIVLNYIPPNPDGPRESISAMYERQPPLTSSCATVHCKSDNSRHVFYMDSIDNNGEQFEIIWHPVMIGDVLDRVEVNLVRLTKNHNIPWSYKKWFRDEVHKDWKDKRKPIDEQNESWIEFIYSLVVSNEKSNS